MNTDTLKYIKDLERRIEDLEKGSGSLIIQTVEDTFELDGSGDLMPYYPESLFEYDSGGYFMPIAGSGPDPYYELDGSGDIMPQV